MLAQNLLFLTVVGIFVGAAAGYVGSFMVIKRMSLVGDALSHVALPGIAVALMLGVSPMLGAFLALMIAVIGVWYLQKNSDIYPEALFGIFFTASLALGVIITPEPDLLEALFGNIEKVGYLEGLIAIIVSVMVIIMAKKISEKMVLGVISEELAKSTGISISKINFIYLLLVGIVVSLGIKFVGSMLMGALVIVPAVSAKNISRGIKSYWFYSIAFGIASAAIGVFLASLFHVSSGPIVVLTSIFIFIITYIIKLT